MNTYKEQKIIRTVYADLNGDGNKEKIVLSGIPVEKDCNHIESLGLMIEFDSGMKKEFNLQEKGIGFNIFAVNVTHSDTEEILLVGNYNKNGAFDTIRIFNYENDDLKVLFDSQSFSQKMNYDITYLDNYKIEITCKNTNEQYLLDISNECKGYLINNYGENGEVINENNRDIIFSVDNVFPVKLPNNDYYSLMIQQGFRLKDYTDNIGGLQTLVDISYAGDLTILDQYLMTKA